MALRAEISTNLRGQEQRHVLRRGDSMVIGRGRNVDFHIEDRSVSRRHLKLDHKQDGVWLTDLGSSNGTLLGGHPLAPNSPSLHYGSEEIVIGEIPIRIKMLARDESTRNLFSLPFLPREEFEVLGLAGRGGLSTVWAARQKLLGREVAIKVLTAPVKDAESEDYQRFLREARLYTKVVSPYIVQLYDVRLAEETPYLVLELVRGPSARARIDRGQPVTVPEALKVGEEMAHALSAVHAAGIVHRDIKPSNVLLTHQGIAKLTDFGLGKHLSDNTITSLNLGMGSLPYVAPEQARSAREAGPRADLYGLGASIFHMICGRPPFEFASGEDLVQRLERVRSEVPPPMSSLHGVPRPLEDLVASLLEKLPQNRPGDAGQVARKLRELRERFFPQFKGRTYFDETWAG